MTATVTLTMEQARGLSDMFWPLIDNDGCSADSLVRFAKLATMAVHLDDAITVADNQGSSTVQIVVDDAVRRFIADWVDPEEIAWWREECPEETEAERTGPWGRWEKEFLRPYPEQHRHIVEALEAFEALRVGAGDERGVA